MRRRGFDAIEKTADVKLHHVAHVWAVALGGVVEDEETPLTRTLLLAEGCEIERLSLSYEVNSKLFASLFDLVYEFDVPRSAERGTESATGDAALELRYDSVKKTFVAPSGRFGLDALECDLVFSRIEQLGITDLAARADAGAWHVRVRGLVGSSTWNLIPPVLHLIEPSRQDCVRGMELFRMVFAALNKV